MKSTILNAGGGSWAFEAQAARLSRAMNLPISDWPADFNYVLGWESETPPPGKSFIPLGSVEIAADKRRIAQVFAAQGVVTPRTHLLETPDAVERWVKANSQSEWVLKWPIGCGGAGHRLQTPGAAIPVDWPRPYVLQEFVRLEIPAVYRLYGVAGELFGWNVRRFPSGAKVSPFVAHAQGARYENAGDVPPEAEKQARLALEATGLLASFGCADLMCDASGNWLVLEVGTDGIFNHVDRDIGVGQIEEEIEEEIEARLSDAFRKWVESQTEKAEPK